MSSLANTRNRELKKEKIKKEEEIEKN